MAASVLALCLSERGLAQPVSLEVIAHWEETSYSVAVRDTLVFTGSDSSLVVLSIADPTLPREIGRTPAANWAPRDIVLRGPYAYVAGSNGVVFSIVDVSDPTRPFVTDSSTTGFGLHTGEAVNLRGDSAFVSIASGMATSAIYDVSNPYDVRRLRGISSETCDFAFTKGALYVFPCSHRPMQVRVTNWSPLAWSGWYWFAEGGASRAGEILEGRLYVVGDGFDVYDVSSDSTLPNRLGGRDDRPNLGIYEDVTLANDLVYVAGGATTFGALVFDASDPSEIELVARFELEEASSFSSPYASKIAFAGGIIFLATQHGGLFLLRDSARDRTPTGLEWERSGEPPGMVSLLEAVAPNPITGSTHITYRTPSAERIRIVVYDLLGREVAVLVDDVVPPGEHSLTWKPAHVPSGAYVLSLQAAGRRESRLISVIR